MAHLPIQKSEETKNFYNDLVNDKVSRVLWGKGKRFSPKAIASKRSVFKYFTSVVSMYISKSDYVLDLGCGPGGFLSIIATLCDKVLGADITSSFVNECNDIIDEKLLANASAILIEPGTLPFPDAHFDKIVMVDTIHHLEHTVETIDEVYRILKKDGLFLIFEPNKLNPLLWVMCYLDKNEHGLLRLGTIKKYRELLGVRYDMVDERYNGLLIGPEGRLSLCLSDIFSSSALSPVIGWLSPKIFIAARKK